MERYSLYKDSGVSWIGNIPEHWEVKRIASLFTGKVQANTDFKYHHAFKFYYGTLVQKNEVGDIEEYRETYVKYSVLRKDDIMINGLNLNFDFVSQRVAIAPSDGIITSAYVVARPRKNTNAQYYNYLFKTMDNMKLFHGMGTGIRLTLSFDEMKKQVVVVPPQDEQQAIVAYIEEKAQKIDTYMADKEKEIELLQELKQKTIADAVTKGLNPDAKMKDSGISWIGEIPEHWEVKRIASLFTGKVQANTDFKYHHAFKFYYGTLVPKNEVGDIEEYRETYVKYSVLKKDDIMINGLNLNYDFVSQRVAIAPSDGIITSAYVVARPRKNTNAQYYNYLFKTMDNMKLFHGMGTGKRLTLSFDEMKKQVVVVPPSDEQQAIVAYIENKCQKIDKLASELQSEIDYLKEYKQRLIADCVTGQVNVQNISEHD